MTVKLSHQLPLLDAEALAISIRPPTPRSEWWVLLSHHQEGRWKVWPEAWINKAAAERFAEGLAGCWTHYQLVRVPAYRNAETKETA